MLLRFALLSISAGALLAADAPCLTPDKTCSEQLALKDGWILVYRTHPLTEGSRTVEHAVVMVHGAQRNGDGYFGTALASAVSRGQLNKSIVIAPHFKGNEGPSCKDHVSPGELFFGCQAWNAGFPAINSDARVNSFDAMDRIVQLLSDKSRFPALRSIVLAGHSGGGQFMQRYAAVNQMEQKAGVPIRYVVANPSSYVYLSDVRLRSDDATCTPEGKCTAPFGVYWDRANCTNYNRYRYGLDNLMGYAATTGVATIRKQFPSRAVTYLIGNLDQLQDTDLDKSCSAQAQGPNRRERGINFWNYMRQQFQADHKLVMVPRCGHNAACMFVASTGAAVLFP